MENRVPQAEIGTHAGIIPELIRGTIATAVKTGEKIVEESLPPELQQGIHAYDGMFKFLEGRIPHPEYPKEDDNTKEELAKLRAELAALMGTAEEGSTGTNENPAQPVETPARSLDIQVQ